MVDEVEKNTEQTPQAGVPQTLPDARTQVAPLTETSARETPPAPPPTGQTETQPLVQPEVNSSSSPLSHPPILNPIPALLAKAREAIFSRKRKKLEKILQSATEKRKITNNDVQRILRISEATATRYLAELEKQGKLKQNRKNRKGGYLQTDALKKLFRRFGCQTAHCLS